jgi:hypothetical protein
MIEFISMFLELFLRLALPTTLKRFALFGRSLRSLPTQGKLAYASRGFRLASGEDQYLPVPSYNLARPRIQPSAAVVGWRYVGWTEYHLTSGGRSSFVALGMANRQKVNIGKNNDFKKPPALWNGGTPFVYTM